MMNLKAVGIAAIAALTMTAAIGAGSAQATVLCTNGTSPCTAPVKVGATALATVETNKTVTIQSNALQVHCNESGIKVEVAKAGSAISTVSGPVLSLTFEECEDPVYGPCNVTVAEKGTFEIHHIAATRNGTVKSQGMTLNVVCGVLECNFITTEVGAEIGTLTGSTSTKGAATLDVSASIATEKPSDLLCNSIGTWEGPYLVNFPVFLDVSAS